MHQAHFSHRCSSLYDVSLHFLSLQMRKSDFVCRHRLKTIMTFRHMVANEEIGQASKCNKYVPGLEEDFGRFSLMRGSGTSTSWKSVSEGCNKRGGGWCKSTGRRTSCPFIYADTRPVCCVLTNSPNQSHRSMLIVASVVTGPVWSLKFSTGFIPPAVFLYVRDTSRSFRPNEGRCVIWYGSWDVHSLGRLMTCVHTGKW